MMNTIEIRHLCYHEGKVHSDILVFLFEQISIDTYMQNIV